MPLPALIHFLSLSFAYPVANDIKSIIREVAAARQKPVFLITSSFHPCPARHYYAGEKGIKLNFCSGFE
jgi:hypothetical protein